MKFLKQVLVSIMLLILSIAAGCQKHSSSCNRKDYWDSPVRQVHDLPGTFGPPVCMVWYKPVSGIKKWQVYKTFSSAEQMFEIKKLLRTDEHAIFKSHNLVDYTNSQTQAKAFKGDQKLSFIYHKPNWNHIIFRDMEFNISDGKFIWPAGESKKLYKIFMEQEQWGNYKKLLDEQYFKATGHYPGENKSDDTDLPLGESPFMQMKQPADI